MRNTAKSYDWVSPWSAVCQMLILAGIVIIFRWDLNRK